jgi:hypothetical protein
MVREKNTNSKGKYIIYKATKRSAFGVDSLYVCMCYVFIFIFIFKGCQ